MLEGQQYRFRVFGQDDGLLNLTVRSVLQDKTGFLWIGTANGVFRYDGSGFTRFSTKDGLPAAYIVALAEGPDGELWAAAHGGLARYENGRFVPVDVQGAWLLRAIAAAERRLVVATDAGVFVVERPPGKTEWKSRGLRKVRASALLAAKDGSIWFDCNRRICKVGPKGDSVEYGPGQGVPATEWVSLAEDKDGSILARSPEHLLRLRAGDAGFAEYGPKLDGGLGRLTVSRQGTLLTDSKQGLVLRSGSGWRTVTEANGLPAGQLTALLEDREGSVWVGVEGFGLARWAGRDVWENWTKRDGLKDGYIGAVAVDGLGRAWVSTGADLALIQEAKHGQPRVVQPFRNGAVSAITAAGDTVWTAFEGKDLVRWNAHTMAGVSYGPAQGLERSTIRGLALDQDDRLWVASLQGLFLGEPRAGAYRFRRFQPADAKTEDLYLEVAQTKDGAVWITTTRGLLRWDGQQWKRYGDGSGLRQARVRHLAPHPDGSLLVSYSDALGVSRIRFDAAGNIREAYHYDAASGLGSDRVYSLAADKGGRMWVGTDRGVDVFDRGRWWHHDRNGGLVWNDCLHSALWIDQAGGAWVGTHQGLSHYLPGARGVTPPAPRVAITGWSLGPLRSGTSFGTGTHLTVPEVDGTPGFQVSLAGLSFLSDQGTRYRYKLHGVDEDWMESEYRDVRYPALPAGRYRFEAYSVSALGGMSESPVELSFVVLAPWWKSWRAMTLLVIGSLLLIKVSWSMRLRMMLARQKVLEEAVRVRTETVVKQKAEIERLLVEAKQANKAKSAFLANMSHEIRTPLNGVLGMADLLLLSNNLESEQQGQATVLRRSALDLRRLLNDLLDMAKIEAGKLELEQTPFLPGQCIGEVVKLMGGLAREKGLVLQEVSAVDGWVLVGDPSRLRQVLTNLTSNAIKFTAAGRITIEAKVTSVGEDRARLEIGVEDQGIGIAPDRVSQIFEPFEQAETSTHRRFGGTGLGLAICRELVGMMRGQIGVESQLGTGSRFFFVVELPRVAAMPEAPAADAERGQMTASMRILLCEDNAVNRKVASRMLEMLGHHVRMAEDGMQAVAVYGEAEFDVVLMDLMMPELDGIEATRRIREIERRAGRRTPIIALTASAFQEDIQRCLEAGMDGYVSKPFVRQALVSEMSRVMDSRPAR